MQRTSVEAIIQGFNVASVRYLIVGGLAVVAHGYVRLTADIDVVLDLDEENRPSCSDGPRSVRLPPLVLRVALDDFIDAAKRASWVREKGLTVFSLYSPEHLATEVDLFVESPFVFADAYARAVHMEVAPGIPATFVGFDDLVTLKRRAGRPQDVSDIAQLMALRKGDPDDT